MTSVARNGPTNDGNDERVLRKNQKILDGFKLNWMCMKDGDSGKILWLNQNSDFSKSNIEHEARIPKKILKCKSICRELNFTSVEEISSFSLVQRIFFK